MSKEYRFQNRELYIKVKDLLMKVFLLLNEKMKRGEKFFSRTVLAVVKVNSQFLRAAFRDIIPRYLGRLKR